MKNFKEFIALWNDAEDLKKSAAQRAYDEIERITEEEGEEPSDAVMALTYSHEMTITMLQAYHLWNNL